MNAQVKVTILRALERMSGLPMTTQTLIDSVRLVHPGLPDYEVKKKISELQTDGLVIGRRNEVLETEVWGLTDKGGIEAAKLM